MKTLLLSLSLFFACSLIMGQVWAPAGATWHYDYANFWVSGYVKIQYTGDTTVAGKSCKVLTKTRSTYDYLLQTYSNIVIGHEYTYFENNVVYYYRYGKFFKLYDFNAVAHDSWEIAGWDSSQLCGDSDVVVVDTAGKTIINSDTLKYLKVSPAPDYQWAFTSDTIIERIGSFGYMFPEPFCVVDLFEGGSLRCYYDNSFGLYEKGYAPSCEYIGVETLHPEQIYFKVYPVPAADIITLEFAKPVKGTNLVEISDIPGNRLKKMTTDKSTLTIDISGLKNGIYFISVTGESGFILKQKFIKNTP
jgi:hypothetical protein